MDEGKNGHDQAPGSLDDLLYNRRRAELESGRQPRMLPAREGRRHVSIGALIERITTAFSQEHADDSAALLASDTKAERLKLLRDTVEYVLAVESVQLSSQQRAALIREAYAELFAYGPLDELFADETITTVTLSGISKVSVRRGHGNLESLSPIFDDLVHMRRIVGRMLRSGGTRLSPDMPFIETGFILDGRRASITVSGPPVTINLSVDIRLHPRALPLLSTMAPDETTRTLVEAVLRSPHGFIIAGEPESGKTTLMSILAAFLPGKGLLTVERAGELHLPEEAERLIVQWPSGLNDDPADAARSFGQQIEAAADRLQGSTASHTLILDEVRADEPGAIAPLLWSDHSARLLWVLRGSTEPKRLAASLSALARINDPKRGEMLPRALYQRLPFVITVRRRKEQVKVHGVAEWQFPEGQPYPDYIELLEPDWEGLTLTGRQPMQPLDLPADFFTRESRD